MNKVFSFVPNSGYTCGSLLIAAKTREQAINTLFAAVAESTYYAHFFDLSFNCYTEGWENSEENVLGVKYVEELDEVQCNREGIIKTDLYDREIC